MLSHNDINFSLLTTSVLYKKGSKKSRFTANVGYMGVNNVTERRDYMLYNYVVKI